MRLATLRTPSGTRAVRVDDDALVELNAPDLGAWLARPDWRERTATASGRRRPVAGARFAPLVPQPSKVICVGLNYRRHIEEMGRPLPTFPTLFTKFADSLTGAGDPLARPVETDQFDWEGELVVVVGAEVRRADGEAAAAAIAGFSVANDATCRDWQNRTNEWMQGKNGESSTPVGPWLVTPDELPGGVRPACRITTEVNGVWSRTTRPPTSSSIRSRSWPTRRRSCGSGPAT